MTFARVAVIAAVAPVLCASSGCSSDSTAGVPVAERTVSATTPSATPTLTAPDASRTASPTARPTTAPQGLRGSPVRRFRCGEQPAYQLPATPIRDVQQLLACSLRGGPGVRFDPGTAEFENLDRVLSVRDAPRSTKPCTAIGYAGPSVYVATPRGAYQVHLPLTPCSLPQRAASDALSRFVS